MTIEFGSPSWLWALLLVPALWAVFGLGRARSIGRQRAIHGALRSLVTVAIITALAEPVVSRVSSRTTLVYLVDLSHSVSARALESVADAIDQMNQAVVPDDIRILGFGGETTTVADTAELRRLATPAAASELDQATRAETTNLEQAIAAARAEIPAGATGRIVLFSDGREHEGDSVRAIERLAADGVPLFTRAMPVRDIGDVWVEALRLPRTPVADAVSTVDVVVGSQAARSVRVAVREGERLLAETATEVPVGSSTVPVDVTFTAVGPHLVTATVTAERDGLPNNNQLASEVIVEPRPRVLYVHAEATRASAAPLALTQAGIDVTLLHPKALPNSPAAFDRWDVVALSNVARRFVSAGAMTALGEWVEERGGGLLFIGGNAVVGEGPNAAALGYRGTEIERVLPVTFEREDEPDVALVIVLDRSWSMNGLPMDLSKVAAEGAARTLDARQMLGILTFNNENNWDVPLARVRDSQTGLHEAIDRITASGPTAIFPALEQAYAQLVAVRARAKHVILLSDGQTAPADFEGLVKDMSAARITVSSVAFGPEADVTLLRNIATWGGGRDYVVLDARQIPEIFVKEAKNASTPGADENAQVAASARRAPGVAGLEGGVPPLSGRNAVIRRTPAIDLLSTQKGDPLLTFWPVGLGRSAMFAADVDGLWTEGWLDWRGFGGFLAALTRSLAPRHLPLRSLEVTAGDRQGEGRVLSVSLEARAADGTWESLDAPRVDVRSARGDRTTLVLSQVGPGRYGTSIAADTAEPLTFALAGASNAVGSPRILVDDAQAEYRFAEPDRQLLSDLAVRTGGSAEATPDDVKRAPAGGGRAQSPLASWLLAAALVFWLGDVAARRFVRGAATV